MLAQRFGWEQPVEVGTVDWYADRDDGTAVRMRTYIPTSLPSTAVLLFHGGGFVAGSIDLYDPVARGLAYFGDVIVHAVDYRLAPEHSAADALADGLTAWRACCGPDTPGWVTGAPGAVVGDSAGATLAFQLCQSLDDDGPAALALLYLLLDLTREAGALQTDDRSAQQEWCLSHAFESDEERLLASALHADPSSLPATVLLVTTELCPLRTDALRFRQKLLAAGRSCLFSDVAGAPHSFLNMPRLFSTQVRSTLELVGETARAMSVETAGQCQ